MNFADAITPIPTKQFTEQYLFHQFLVVEGPASKFSQLVSWKALNDVLASVRVSGPRVRLAKDGIFIAPTRYLQEAGKETGSLLNAEATTRLLRDGATLILNQADELFPILRALAESCEHAFRIAVQANLYAAWGEQRGFDLHWDEHDTLVLQIAGRKQWDVYAPTRIHPIQDDVTGTPEPPTAPPVWSGILEGGHLLYMPRGWWHVARPMNEPTLHVTIGLRHPRGIDLLRWLSEQMQAHEVVRMPLPHLAPGAQSSYTDLLRQCLQDAVAGDLVERFMRATDWKARLRPRFDLPESVLSDTITIPLKADTPLRLVTPRRLHCKCENGSDRLTFEAAARTWTCDARLRPALEMLSQTRWHSYDAVSLAVVPELALVLRVFLELLAKSGVVETGTPTACIGGGRSYEVCSFPATQER